MEVLGMILWIVAGTLMWSLGYTKVAYIFFGISILTIGDVVYNIKKHGNYHAWKSYEQARIEKYKNKLDTKKKVEKEIKNECDMKIDRANTYILEKYKKRQEEAAGFKGLFYPDLGGYEIPVGYHDIPVSSYIVFDLETTGLTPTHDEILEIGAIRIVDGNITGVFHEYVRPGCQISNEISKINGITNDMVKNCRSIDKVLPDFIEFMERLPIVAYNVEFDYSFIKEAWFKITGKSFTRKHFCAMKIYKKYHKEICLSPTTSAKLSDAVKEILGPHYFEEFIKVNHQALVDTSAAQFIFEAIGGVAKKN